MSVRGGPAFTFNLAGGADQPLPHCQLRHWLSTNNGWLCGVWLLRLRTHRTNTECMVVGAVPLTSDHHHTNGKNLLVVRVCWDVAKPYAGQAAQSEIEWSDVGAGVVRTTFGLVEKRQVQSGAQLVQPSWKETKDLFIFYLQTGYSVPA